VSELILGCAVYISGMAMNFMICEAALLRSSESFDELRKLIGSGMEMPIA
jgi:hypothetical protein